MDKIKLFILLFALHGGLVAQYNSKTKLTVAKQLRSIPHAHNFNTSTQLIAISNLNGLFHLEALFNKVITCFSLSKSINILNYNRLRKFSICFYTASTFKNVVALSHDLYFKLSISKNFKSLIQSNL